MISDPRKSRVQCLGGVLVRVRKSGSEKVGRSAHTVASPIKIEVLVASEPPTEHLLREGRRRRTIETCQASKWGCQQASARPKRMQGQATLPFAPCSNDILPGLNVEVDDGPEQTDKRAGHHLSSDGRAQRFGFNRRRTHALTSRERCSMATPPTTGFTAR